MNPSHPRLQSMMNYSMPGMNPSRPGDAGGDQVGLWFSFPGRSHGWARRHPPDGRDGWSRGSQSESLLVGSQVLQTRRYIRRCTVAGGVFFF